MTFPLFKGEWSDYVKEERSCIEEKKGDFIEKVQDRKREIALIQQAFPDFKEYRERIADLLDSAKFREYSFNPAIIWKLYCLLKYEERVEMGTLDRILGI